MRGILQKEEECFASLKETENIQKLYRYFKNKKFVLIFIDQYENILTNMKSISLLEAAGNINDGFTILRKYLETYLIMMSLIVHPDLVEAYIRHNEMLSYKACNKEKEKVRIFSDGKPDNYLEYGYLEKYIDHSQGDFKYSAKSAAVAGDVLQFHRYYKMCNNFVHNNLTSVKVDQEKGRQTLIKALKETSTLMNSRLESIINENEFRK